MKLTKQQTTIVLAVLLVGLVAAFIFNYKSMFGGAPAPAAASEPTDRKPGRPAANDGPATAATAPTLSEEPGDMTWVSSDLSHLVDMVAVSRNPFVNLMPEPVDPTQAPPPPPGPTTPPAPGPIDGPLPGPMGVTPTPAVVTTFSESVKLDWASVSDLAAAMRRKGYGVTVKASPSNPGWALVSGPVEMRAQALDLIQQLNTPPPVPHFELQGVVITPERTVAYIALDGKTHAVKQGQAIPHVGWTVTAVSSNRVIVSDGRRSKDITLSGGGSR